MDDQQEASNAGFVVAFGVLALPATVATSRPLPQWGLRFVVAYEKPASAPCTAA